MSVRRSSSILAFSISLLALASIGAAAEEGSAVGPAGQTVVTSVDWESGVIAVTISRPISDQATNTPAAISRTQTAIERDAVGVIASELAAIPYDSLHTIGELLEENEALIAHLLSAAERARPFDAKGSADLRSAQVSFRLSLYEDLLARFITHTSARPVDSLLRWVPTRDFTGIVIYAAEAVPIHGTDRVELIVPALRPALYYYGPEGRELFTLATAENTDPVWLARWGSVGYTSRIDETTVADRVGPNPLRVVAYGGFGRHPSGIVLDRAAADQLMASEANRRLVAEGRVAVILDERALLPARP